MYRRLAGMFSLVIALLGLAACVGVDDISLVQPNYVKKTAFDGQWYFRQTVIEVPSEASGWQAVYEGMVGDTDKVRFKVTEKALIAYRDFEFIEGIQESRTSTLQHTPIAAWPITDQFDIIRDYNKATGERSNQIVENKDRHWYDREYMRVDWSTEISPNTMGSFGLYLNYLSASPANYYVPNTRDEKDNPDRIEFALPEAGDTRYPQEKPYAFHVTNKYNIEPAYELCLYELNDWFSWSGNCGPATVKLRNSFLKVDPKEVASYEPLQIPDKVQLYHPTQTEPANCTPGTPGCSRVALRSTRLFIPDDPADIKPWCEGNVVNSTVRIREFACTPQFLNSSLAQTCGVIPQDCDVARADHFDKFGFFRNERLVYDRDRNIAESARKFLGNRFNIWEKSRDPVIGADGKQAVDGFGKPIYQTIPMRDRKTKKIVFYMNPQYPLEDPKMVEAYRMIGCEWNNAFKQAVGAARGLTVTPPPRGTCLPPNYGVDYLREVEDIFVVKENTCSVQGIKKWSRDHGKEQVLAGAGFPLDSLTRANIEPACATLEWETRGEPKDSRFTWEKQGDLRYSFLHWVDRQQFNGPLGLGPSASDPETGMVLSGTANMYGAAVDTISAYAADIVGILNGTIPSLPYMEGDIIRQQIEKAGKRHYRIAAEPIPDGFAENLNKLVQDTIGRDWMLDQKIKMAERAGTKPLGSLTDGHGEPGAVGHAAEVDTLFDRIRGTKLETGLLDDNFSKAAFGSRFGWKPGMSITREMLDVAGPLAKFTPKAANERFKKQLKRSFIPHNGCAYEAGFADDTVIGLAMQYKNCDATGQNCNPTSWEDVKRQMRRDIMVSVSLHEIGHNVGLTHNFEASTDALNYMDDFWKIRNAVGGDAQQMALKRAPEFKYASVMDYARNWFTEMHGLGKYDTAAIKFGYTNLVERPRRNPDQTFVEPVSATTSQVLEFDLDILLRYIDDYTSIPSRMGSVAKIGERDNANYDDVKKLRVQAMLSNANNADTSTPKTTLKANPVEIPYRYCPDQFAQYGLTCRMWDQGASQREIIEDMSQRWKTYYIFGAFKRDRFNYDYWGYIMSLYSRYFQWFSNEFQWYAYWGGGQSAFSKDLGYAAVQGLNALVDVLQSPAPGRFCKDGPAPSNTSYGTDMFLPTNWFTANNQCLQGQQSVDVQIPDGMDYWFDFSDNNNYYITKVGSLYMKLFALIALTDSTSAFYRADALSSIESFSISFFRTFREQLLTVMGGLITDDYKEWAAVITSTGANGGAEYSSRVLVDPRDIAAGKIITALPPPGTIGVIAPASVMNITQVTPTSVKPLGHYTMKLYANYFGMGSLTSSLDRQMDFAKYGLVAIPGTDLDFTCPAARLVQVTDPTSFQTYAACQSDDNRSFAYEYVRRAKEYHDTMYVPCMNDVNCQYKLGRKNTMMRYIEWMDTQRLYYRYLAAER